MGRQVEFFVYGIDEYEFIKMITDKGGGLVDYNSYQIKIEDLNNEIHTCYIKFNMSNMVNSESGIIDPIESDIIQYSRCLNTQENIIRSGRLWAEFKYYGKCNELITKEKWFAERFNSLSQWIRKNYKLSKCRHYYISKNTYIDYYNSGYIMKAGPKQIIEF